MLMVSTSNSLADNVTSQWSPYFQTDSEQTYQVFLSDCFNAGSKACPLREPTDKTASDIEARIDLFTQKLVTKPLQISGTDPGYVTAGAIRSKSNDVLFGTTASSAFERHR